MIRGNDRGSVRPGVSLLGRENRFALTKEAVFFFESLSTLVSCTYVMLYLYEVTGIVIYNFYRTCVFNF